MKKTRRITNDHRLNIISLIFFCRQPPNLKKKKKQQKESIIFFFDNFQLMNEKRRLRAEIRKKLKRHSHFGSLLIPRRDTFCSFRAQLTHTDT